MPDAGARSQSTVSQHGTARSELDDGPYCGDCPGAKCGSGVHLRRREDSRSWRHGYETAVEGKNGFVCLVERAWMSPFKSAGFWNQKIGSPLCYNPQAAHSILPFDYKRPELARAGQSKAQIIDWMTAADAKKELPDVEPGAMCYMKSNAAYLTDDHDHNLAHLMCYTPLMDGKNWGADLVNPPASLENTAPTAVHLVRKRLISTLV